MKEAFINHSFSAVKIGEIERVNSILTEYRRQGFRLSLRQLYYQLVARGYIPNNIRSYKNTGNLVSTARQAGYVDWEMIEDRGRETETLTHWNSPADIVAAAARQFRIEKWSDQPFHIEVMVEKDALSGVLIPTCQNLDIGITANKGYSSSSTMYEIGKRLADQHDNHNKEICVLYLGDHDPSGIDMTRDVEERLKLYSGLESLEVVRLALNIEQVRRWNPPENPAKETDSRFLAYRREFGPSSWELDAVEPRQLAQLVIDLVNERRDPELWAAAIERENAMKYTLQNFVDEYNSNEDADEDGDNE